MKMLIIEPVSKSTENDHYFGREIREPGQPDGGKYAKTESKRRQRHLFCQATHRIKVERGNASTNFAGNGEKESDGKTVREHQNRRVRSADNICAGDSETTVAHVHEAGITQHPIEP